MTAFIRRIAYISWPVLPRAVPLLAAKQLGDLISQKSMDVLVSVEQRPEHAYIPLWSAFARKGTVVVLRNRCITVVSC